MAIGPYTQKFQEQSHQYLCMVAQERAEVGCLKERLTQNPADFKALMDSIISVERIGGSNGVVRAQLEESCGFLAQNAMAYEGMSSELLVAAMVGVFSRELSLCEQLSVYSSITGYTTARAKAFVEEYMTIIEGIKANTVNPAVGLNQIRVYQRLLVELAPYFPKEERTQKYVEETQEYLSSGRRESLSSTREAIQIGDLTERLEEYQRQIERKGEAALQVINLAEKIIAMQTALSTLPAEERMAKEEELSSTKDRWEQANANQIYLLQMAPLDQVLESVKEYLANYEEGDLADVSRLFESSHLLSTSNMQ